MHIGLRGIIEFKALRIEKSTISRAWTFYNEQIGFALKIFNWLELYVFDRYHRRISVSLGSKETAFKGAVRMNKENSSKHPSLVCILLQINQEKSYAAVPCGNIQENLLPIFVVPV